MHFSLLDPAAGAAKRAAMSAHIGKRWGFKPKSSSTATSTVTSESSAQVPPPPQPAAAPPSFASTSGSGSNNFSNDGSFFAQFQQKMKQEQDEQKQLQHQKLSNQRQQQQKLDDVIQKRKMEACDAKRYFAAAPSPVSGNLPADWYQAALEKARGIAKSLNQQQEGQTSIKTGLCMQYVYVSVVYIVSYNFI